MNAVSLTSLKLTDFRNYRQLAVELDWRHVVLTGENGAGKTNLMEAVSLLSPGRGLRRAAYSDIPRRGTTQGFAPQDFFLRAQLPTGVFPHHSCLKKLAPPTDFAQLRLPQTCLTQLRDSHG